jgi:hypothetical protein
VTKLSQKKNRRLSRAERRRATRTTHSSPSHFGVLQAFKTRTAQVCCFLASSLLVAIFLHFSSDKFPDPDVFYHFRHAEIYGDGGAGGIFRTDFPWVHYSVISRLSSDLWYGFHLILVPFTWLGDSILGMQLAGIFVTFTFLLLCYVAYWQLRVSPALFWPFFLLFSSAYLLHRLGMLRPQVLSLGLSTCLFVLLAAGNVWGVFVTTLASTWLHLNFFFVSFLILGVFAVVKVFNEKIVPWRESLALAGGVLVGWLLRPNPVGAAQILYVQLVQLGLEKAVGLPLDLASEMSPLKLKSQSNYLPFTLVLFFSLLYLFWAGFRKHRPLSIQDRTVLWTSAALSIIFFLLSVLVARRAFDFCSAFGVILIGLVFSRYLYANWGARLALMGALVFLVPYGLTLRNQVLSVGWDPHRFESGAKWMAANSEPGEIVFNARWEYFPELFFWNTKNFYSNGMDPIFQYAFNSDLYRKAYDLTNDSMAPMVRADSGGKERGFIDPYKILKEDFKARYVFLAKPFDRSLYMRLRHDSRFSLKLENESSAVFQIN